MNRSMRSDLKKSVRTVLSSREGGMDEWLPRRVEPDVRESDEQVEAVLLQLRGLLAREGGALTGDVEKDAAIVLAARRRGHCVDLVIGRKQVCSRPQGNRSCAVQLPDCRRSGGIKGCYHRYSCRYTL